MHVDLKLGLSCNNKCLHCIMEPVRLDLSARGRTLDTPEKNIHALLSDLPAKGVTSVTLTGGEPTLRQDFFDILKQTMDTKLDVTVQTNGRCLAAPKAREHLAALPGRDVLFVVALHGQEASLHDAVTRVPGSFGETSAALSALVELGFPVCGKLVLSRLNLEAVVPTLELMKRLGIGEAVVAYPHAEEFSPAALEKVLPSYAELRNVLSALPAPPAPLKRIIWETIPFCVFPDQRYYRFSQDLAFLQDRLRKEKVIIEMSMTRQVIEWEESRKAGKGKPDQCRSCLMDRVCEGIWAESLAFHGGGDLAPITDRERVRSFLECL
jgi:MoaA/NifB/PqqE/SkfB family radical SAM enzyme